MNSFQSAWNKNRGNLLLVIAALASVMVSCVWYFDLLPNIRFVSAEQPLSVASPVANPPSIIVVTLEPDKTPSEEPVSGYVRVHSPFGRLPESPSPIAFREFTVIDQRIMPVVFTELPAGQYALSAFLDLNENGLLDFDDKGIPLEPVRMSNLKNPSSESLELEDAGLTLGVGQALNLKLSFGS